jgi:polyhydroxybutyrate depolymerase
MLMRWNKKVILILLLALPLACIYSAQTTGTSTPQTADSSTPQTSDTNAPQTAGTSTPQTAGTAIPLTGQHKGITILEGKTPRTALVYIPNSYSSAKTVALILNFHGLGSTGPEQETLTGMSILADKEGFLVAYPNGGKQNGKQEWDSNPGSADLQFVSDLVKKIQADYSKVDSKRIYATGMSNGGGMTNRVGCDMVDIFAAIAPVEGGYPDPGWKDCDTKKQPMPVMAFHGFTDPVVPYGGGHGMGPATLGVFPSILDWAAEWAKRDSCSATPTVTTPTATQPNAIKVTRREWTQCAGGASVILFTINPHGHVWPRGAPIDATAEVWRFFQAHPKT